MRSLLLPLTPRFICLTLAVLGALVCASGIVVDSGNWSRWLAGFIVFGGFSLLGVRDLLQTRHAVLRSYPIAAHLRFLLERVRPEIPSFRHRSDRWNSSRRCGAYLVVSPPDSNCVSVNSGNFWPVATLTVAQPGWRRKIRCANAHW